MKTFAGSLGFVFLVVLIHAALVMGHGTGGTTATSTQPTYVPAHVPGLITNQARPTLAQQLAACQAQLGKANCTIETDDDGYQSVYGRRTK